jgi:hypothetical protein
MLTLDEIKVAVVMMRRAQCTGEEAADVAIVLEKLLHEYAKMTAPKTPVPIIEDEDGNN